MKKIKHLLSLSLLVFTILLLVQSCKNESPAPILTEGKTIAASASESSDFNVLSLIITKIGYANFLNNNSGGVYTVFAPTDEAFLRYFKTGGAGGTALILPSGTLPAGVTAITDENSLVNVISVLPATSTTTNAVTLSSLATLISNHILGSKIPSSAFTGVRQPYFTYNNNRLEVSRVGSSVFLNVSQAKVVVPDVVASNGIIHGIDGVIIAPAASLAAIIGIGVNYTTNVITPAAPNAATQGNNNLFDYNILAHALVRTGLVTALVPNAPSQPDITVFAPTDGSFLVLLRQLTGNATLNEDAAIRVIRGSTNPIVPGLTVTDLTDILRYHVSSSRLLSTSLTPGLLVPTLSGKTFTVNVNTGVISITDANAVSPDAKIIQADILTATGVGVVHAIDQVLRPI
jgi:uncharacterized surface protein with fasciclin (FAS1) repeats